MNENVDGLEYEKVKQYIEDNLPVFGKKVESLKTLKDFVKGDEGQ